MSTNKLPSGKRVELSRIRFWRCRIKWTLFVLLSFPVSFSLAQSRTISGKVLDEALKIIPDVKIQDKHGVTRGTTDTAGKFEIQILDGSFEIIFSALGLEMASIKVPSDCNKVEVILMTDGTYDYRSNSKVDRMRRKRFNTLSRLHADAAANGLFTNKSPCYSREFTPNKPRLDEIRSDLKLKRRQLQKSFENLQIGDTIRIPFSARYRDDGTDRTILFQWSYVTDKEAFDCVIEGIILDKNTAKGGYNIVYKVSSREFCKYDSLVFERKEMAIGKEFVHNMKYFKVLTKSR
jgi:hypothetical protein